jgi:hypothetical protein
MNVFNRAVLWSEESLKTTGLPRPYVELSEEDRYSPNTEKYGFEKYLAKKLPMPWQTRPVFQGPTKIRLIKENEEKVFKEGLCAYCAVKLNLKDPSVIWTYYQDNPIDDKNKVFSDFHPFHLECMKQARAFCPYMKQRPESEFKYGDFQDLVKASLAFVAQFKRDN